MSSFPNGQDAVELKFYVKNTFFHVVEENAVDACMPRRRKSAPALGKHDSDIDSARLFQSLLDVAKDVAQGAIRPSIQSAQSTDCTDSECEDNDGDGLDEECDDEFGVEDIHSLIVRGIPSSYYGEDILNIFVELGFNSEPEFFYVPMAQGRNFGYAMIGFSDLQTTKDFTQALAGYRFPHQPASEIVTVTPSGFQF